jgi:hypothetical protein
MVCRGRSSCHCQQRDLVGDKEIVLLTQILLLANWGPFRLSPSMGKGRIRKQKDPVWRA